MDLETFIKKIAELFTFTPREAFSAKTKFKELSEWDSLQALHTLLLIEDEMGVALDQDAFAKSETLEDLYRLAESIRARK